MAQDECCPADDVPGVTDDLLSDFLVGNSRLTANLLVNYLIDYKVEAVSYTHLTLPTTPYV